MKVIIVIFFLSCLCCMADCKTIEQSCNLRPIVTGRCKTIERSCEIKSSPLRAYLKRLRECQESNNDSSTESKIRKDSALAAYLEKLRILREKRENQ